MNPKPPTVWSNDGLFKVATKGYEFDVSFKFLGLEKRAQEIKTAFENTKYKFFIRENGDLYLGTKKLRDVAKLSILNKSEYGYNRAELMNKEDDDDDDKNKFVVASFRNIPLFIQVKRINQNRYVKVFLDPLAKTAIDEKKVEPILEYELDPINQTSSVEYVMFKQPFAEIILYYFPQKRGSGRFVMGLVEALNKIFRVKVSTLTDASTISICNKKLTLQRLKGLQRALLDTTRKLEEEVLEYNLSLKYVYSLAKGSTFYNKFGFKQPNSFQDQMNAIAALPIRQEWESLRSVFETLMSPRANETKSQQLVRERLERIKSGTVADLARFVFDKNLNSNDPFLCKARKLVNDVLAQYAKSKVVAARAKDAIWRQVLQPRNLSSSEKTILDFSGTMYLDQSLLETIGASKHIPLSNFT